MTLQTTSRASVLLLSLALLVGGLALPAATVSAATQHVTDCGDAGANTLRGKIAAAASGDTIVFDQDCTIVLTTGTLTIPAENLTIDASGHTVIVDGGCTASCGTVDAVGGVTVFHILRPPNLVNLFSVTLGGLTIQHGNCTTTGCGGGGIYLDSDAVSKIQVFVINCTITGNRAYGDGGGILTGDRTYVINSTITGNSANRGGGASNLGGGLNLVNSTVTGNTSIGFPNSRGGGIYSAGGTFAANSIVAGNSSNDGPDFKGDVRSYGNNLIGNADETVITQLSPGWIASDLTGTSASPLNPVLGTLGTYGGRTQTIPLLPGSPAIAAGATGIVLSGAYDPISIPTTDQRGVARTGHTDIGAFQSQGFTTTKTGGDNQSQQILAPFAPLTLTITATAAGAPYNEPVQGGILAVTLPASGASATINTNTVNASGQASITLTANGTAGGPYTVTIGASALSLVTYTLTNLAAPANATYTVGTTADHAFGPVSAATCRIAANTTCALRDAIAFARSGTDTIVFNGTGQGTITLIGGNGPLVLAGNMTITGPGADRVLVDGGCCAPGGNVRDGITVFVVKSGATASISGLTIQHGNASIVAIGSQSGADFGGGGIYNTGTLTVTGSTIRANRTPNGIDNNNYGITGIGGGIFNDGGTVTLTSSTVSGNTAASSGGGLQNRTGNGGTMTVTNSTVTGNAATYSGGGIDNSDNGTLTVTNSTITGNSAQVGGAISNSSTVTVTNSTVTGNSAPSRGGGIDHGFGTMTVTNTIVAGNSAPSAPDLYANYPITTGGHNLFGTTSGATITLAPSDLVNPTPRLGTLGSNGGPTQTISLLTGSPAIDAGDDTVCASTTTPAGAAVSGKDQRGIPRPQGTHCDIGAFEVAVVNALPGTKPSAPAGGPTNPLPAVRPAGASGQGGPAPNPLPAPRP